MFNSFDIICLVIILCFGALGFRTGIIATFFYVASGFAGMWVAHNHAEQLGVGFYAAFILVAAVIIVGGYTISKFLHALLFGIWDKIVGSLLGMVLGVILIVSIVVPLVIKMPVSIQITAARSYSSANIIPGILRTVPLLDYVKFDRLQDAVGAKVEAASEEVIDSGRKTVKKAVKKAIKEF